MSTRSILQDPGILHGRWRFDGTNLAVAEVRAAVQADPQSAAGVFRRHGISRADVRAAMQFTFPDVRPLAISQNFASVTVHCVCGEDTPTTTRQQANATVACVCGRHWRIHLHIVQLTDRSADGSSGPAPNQLDQRFPMRSVRWS
jgi:uncharacterized protein (DUF433 family)